MRFVFCFLAVLLLSRVYAEKKKYQITIMTAPTLEHYTGFGRSPKLSYNTGLDYKLYLDPLLTFQTGIYFQNKGYKVPIELYEGFDILMLHTYSLNFITIPTNFNFHIKTGTRNRIVLTTGISNGYNISQTRRMNRVKAEDALKLNEEYSVIYDNVRIETVDLFAKRYTGVNLGINFQQNIKKKVVFELGTFYSRQLNNSISKNYIYNGKPNRLQSFSLEFKLGYFINPQISQRENPF